MANYPLKTSRNQKCLFPGLSGIFGRMFSSLTVMSSSGFVGESVSEQQNNKSCCNGDTKPGIEFCVSHFLSALIGALTVVIGEWLMTPNEKS